MFTQTINNCKFGDILLANLPFSEDPSSYKKRPVLVLKKNKHDYLVAKITSQLQNIEDYDVELHPDNGNGLKEISLLKIFKITSISKEILLGKLGTLNLSDQKEVKDKLLTFFNSL